MNSLTIQTPSRLHFGLLGWGPHSLRQFGGFGLMVDDPGIKLKVEPADHWQVVGGHSERCLEISKRLASQFDAILPTQIDVESLPREHIGLGVGTQLSLALAKALSVLYRFDDIPIADLARSTGRGMRSGIGIHGFAKGGLIVDVGRRFTEEIPTLIQALEFPQSWSILLAMPTENQGLHGKAELKAFQRLDSMPVALTDRICRRLLLQVLPAVIETDFESFGEGLSEIQKDVGATFAPVQGGSFASPETEVWINAMRQSGLRGVGQSSWGPTLYGFHDENRQDLDRESIIEFLQNQAGAKEMTFVWTKANHGGYRLIR